MAGIPSWFTDSTTTSAATTTPTEDPYWNINGTNTLLLDDYEAGGEEDGMILPKESYGLLETILLSGALLVIIVGTIVGNILVCTAVCLVRRLRRPCNYLLVSLAVSDLCVALLVMPMALVYEVLGTWPFGATVCDAWVAFDVLSCTASILNLCMISVDRYWAITRPLDYGVKRTPARMCFCVALVWISSACISLPPLLVLGNEHGTLDDQQCQVCQEFGYQIYATLGSFYIPLGVMVAVYYQIFQAAKRIVDEEKKAQSHLLLSGGGGGGGGGSSRAQQHPETVRMICIRAAQQQAPPNICDDDDDDAEAGHQQQNQQDDHHPTIAGSLITCQQQQNGRLGAPSGGTSTPAPVWPDVCSPAASMAVAGGTRVSRPSLDIPRITGRRRCSSDTSDIELHVAESGSSGGGVGGTHPAVLHHQQLQHVPHHQTCCNQSSRSNSSGTMTTTTHRTIHHQHHSRVRLRFALNKERKASTTLGIIMSAFTLCWFPFFVLALARPFVAQPDLVIPRWLSSLFLWLGYANSFLNPVIYATTNKDFRLPFKEILCLRCKSLNSVMREDFYQSQYGGEGARTALSGLNKEEAGNQLPCGCQHHHHIEGDAQTVMVEAGGPTHAGSTFL